jgi:hypothetical protein
MNYSFKLSRRLARFRTTVPIIAVLLTISCSDDPSGPGSNAAAGPSSITISPDSVSVGLDEAVQFGAYLDNSSPSFAKGGNGKGRGRRTIVSVAVTPQTTALEIGTSNRFSAIARLSDGTTASPSLSWTATGGSIDQTGLYTAGKTVGSYRVIAAATDGVADTANVTVATSAPTATLVRLSPGSKTLIVGTTAQFALIGKASDGSTVGVSPVFAATGGTITSAGLYTAGQTPGTFRVIATDQNTDLADTAAITVSAVPTWQSWTSSPASVSLASGKTQQFAVTATMSDGSTPTVTPTWKATGGTISSTGLYTAGQTAGSYRVIAADTAAGLADTSVVMITTPAVQAVTLTPTTVSLAAGGTQQFAASGKMSDGSTAPITATFVATGGTISSTGFYTAGSTPGTFRVIATQSGGTLADTASVSITGPSSPPTSGTTYFLADAESGTSMPPWSVTSVCSGYGGCASNSTDRAHSGARSWKIDLTDPQGCGGHAWCGEGWSINSPQSQMCPNPAEFCTGYYSAWMYLDAGWTGTNWNATFNFLANSSPYPDPVGHVGIGVRNGVLQFYWSMKNCQVGRYVCPDIPGYNNVNGDYFMTSTSPAGIKALPKGQWVHFAVYYKVGRTNGQIRMWQDGELIEDLTAPTLNTQDGNQFMAGTGGLRVLGFSLYEGPVAEARRSLYLDDIRVSNYRPVP